MNSPEEKAKIILNKVEGALDGSLPTGGEPYLKETIAIGLICVDEIIAANVDNGYGYGNIKNDYWYQVKEYIQTL